MSTDFASEPQPRTIGASKEDVLSNLMYFFGAPVSPEKLKDYSEHHALTYHFPGAFTRASNTHTHLVHTNDRGLWRCADAYAGSNTKIRDTLNNLIIKVSTAGHTIAHQERF